MDDTIDDKIIDAYLLRIGASKPERADEEALRHLQERHVLSVPFETLAFQMGEPVPHSMDAVRKVVIDHRGGTCFEVNSAFAMLLRALGYQVDLLGGMIYRSGVMDQQMGHMALRVRTAQGSSWLVDVGQGRHSRWPLRLDSRVPQEDPHGRYLLAEAAEGDLDVSVDGDLLYRVEPRGRSEEYGAPIVWWYRTSPQSPFSKRPICILPTEKGKVTLLGDKLIQEEGGRRTARRLTTEGELRAAYRTWFGIELDRLPDLSGKASSA